MIKAVFTDFYGTLVHEDGEVAKRISREIYDSGRAVTTLTDLFPFL